MTFEEYLNLFEQIGIIWDTPSARLAWWYHHLMLKRIQVLIQVSAQKIRSNDSGFMRSGKSGKKAPFTQGVMESQGIWKFLHKKSEKKIPVENEGSRSTFGFQNFFP